MGGVLPIARHSKTVEIYSHTSSQWHTAKPLPTPCYWMTSVNIDDTCYILGGRKKHCFSESLDSLIDSATSPRSLLNYPVWMSVSGTPLTESTAASLRGSLVAIGGARDTKPRTTSSAIHILTSDGSWEWVREGDLPEPCERPAAVCLPTGELLVIGGSDGHVMKRTVFIASVID